MTTTYKIKDLPTVAKNILDRMKSKILLIYGPMGSGKTTLVKAIVNELGGNKDVSSPTFSIVNEYDVENDKVYHFDMYRIDNETEALDIGVEEYFYSGHYNFVEWPNKIKSLLPLDADSIYLSINPDDSRSLNLNHSLNLTL